MREYGGFVLPQLTRKQNHTRKVAVNFDIIFITFLINELL